MRRAAFGTRPDQLLLVDHLALMHHLPRRAIHQRQIQPLLGEPPAQRARCIDRQIHHDQRIELGKAPQNRRHEALADIVGRAEPDDPLHFRHAKAPDRLVRQRQHPPRIGKQHLAAFRQRHRARIA